MTIFEWQVRIYYEDTDFSGFVYHANYLKFFERARTEGLRQLGYDQKALKDAEDPVVFAVRDMQITFVRPAHMDDVLTIRTEPTKAGGAKLVFRQTALRGEEIIAEADVTVACLSADGRPRRLPSSLKAGFTGEG